MLCGMIFLFQVNNHKKFESSFFAWLVFVVSCLWGVFVLFCFLSSVADLCTVNFQKLS